MDVLSRIATWLSDHEATSSAVVGIAVLSGVFFAGVRSLLLRGAARPDGKASGGSEPPAPASSPLDLDSLTVPGFGGNPALAVLPFENLSDDPDQEYFADGLAEDLITRLSARRDVPIIARNSSFTYKGRPVDVKQVSRELGVRYVVEGSVRKVENRVRISAQLIDAITGSHVWAERYDRELRDIFGLQDEITEAICGAIQPQLRDFERRRAMRRRPENLEAWDCVQRGLWHTLQWTRDDVAAARSLAGRALELDAGSARAYQLLAATHAGRTSLRPPPRIRPSSSS